MAEVITRGGVRFTDLQIGGISGRVRAPGMHVRWASLDIATMPVDGEIFAAAGEEDGGWAEAIAANELEPIGAVAAQPMALEEASPVIATPDSPDMYAELQLDAAPGESLLLMADIDGVVQWYAPANAPQAVDAPLGFTDEAGPTTLTFRVPHSAMAAGETFAGFGEGSGGAILRVFRVKLIRELLGAPLRFVLDWIIDKVEKRAKPREGFRFFDSAQSYPFLSTDQLQALAGQRVLLLTHGIFSSLEGAFAGISNPKSEVLKHLRGVYGENIIGWDHWTVGKTPLENAAEMLMALPPTIQPDIICHSRGGLVTRAMLEHPTLMQRRQQLFPRIGKAIFVAGANQGSQLANLQNINRLLNIYSAVASFPALGGVGVVLKVIVGVLRVLAHGASGLASVEALSSDLDKNEFLRALNDAHMTPAGELVVVHANYDPSKGPLARFLDLNVDFVFKQPNDMVVPFTGAATFDKWQQVGTNIQFGTNASTQSAVMHTNFFMQSQVHDLIRAEL
ncbi:MAG TPA: hypothetical protein VGF48_10550 [Thermoanaerobaculia bacterium]|jgi:hypothetical protein